MSRQVVGDRLAPRTFTTLSHGEVQVPDPHGRWVHRSFRRFAGCPICNLHLREVAARIGELHGAGVRTIASLHSTAASMRPFQGDLPFAVVPDPEKRWFAEVGVEEGVGSVLHPAAALRMVRGMFTAPSNPIRGEGGHLGLPADFLVATGGTLAAVHYGSHAADGWSVDDLLASVGAAQGTGSTPSRAART